MLSPTDPTIWQTIAPSIVTGTTGLAGAFLGAWLAGVRENRHRRLQDSRDSLYLVVTLGAHLRKIVSECLAVAQDDGTNDFGEPSERTKDGEQHYSPRATKPSLKIPEMEIEWRILPPDLLDEVFALHLFQEDADTEIGIAATYDHPPDYADFFLTRQLAYAKLGLRVLDVSERLRAFVKLPPYPEPNIAFTTKHALQRVVNEMEAHKAAIAEANEDEGPRFSVEAP